MIDACIVNNHRGSKPVRRSWRGPKPNLALLMNINPKTHHHVKFNPSLIHLVIARRIGTFGMIDACIVNMAGPGVSQTRLWTLTTPSAWGNLQAQRDPTRGRAYR